MRISDWSSDVCSSDLAQHRLDDDGGKLVAVLGGERRRLLGIVIGGADELERRVERAFAREHEDAAVIGAVNDHDLRSPGHRPRGDRKGVGEGKSVSVRVDLGGRSTNKNKKNKHDTE